MYRAIYDLARRGISDKDRTDHTPNVTRDDYSTCSPFSSAELKFSHRRKGAMRWMESLVVSLLPSFFTALMINDQRVMTTVMLVCTHHVSFITTARNEKKIILRTIE